MISDFKVGAKVVIAVAGCEMNGSIVNSVFKSKQWFHTVLVNDKHFICQELNLRYQ